MKKKKILVLFPVLGLLLSGCTFQEGFTNVKSWVSQHIYHPIKDWITGGGNKEEPSDGGGEEEKTLQEIVSVSAPASIKKGETLAPSSVDLVVKYSDKSTAAVKAESVDLDTSTVGDAVQGTAHYKTLSKTFNIKVYEEGGGEGEKPEHAGTEADPYTGADAVIVANGLEQGGVTAEYYYIKGKVTALKEAYSAEYGNYSFEIEGGFIGWRLKNGSSYAKFNEGDIAVDDVVTMYVQIQLYGDDKLAESKNGYVVKVEKPASGDVLTSIEIGGTPQTSYVESASYNHNGLTVTAHYEGAADKDVTNGADWSISKEKAAVGDELITITASYTDGEITKTATKDVEVTVTAKGQTEHAGTETDPFTAADAITTASSLSPGQMTEEEYYIKGEVKEFYETFSTQYGSYSFKIENNFKGHRLKNGPDKTPYTTGKEIEVGDTVTMKGKIKNYNGDIEVDGTQSGGAYVVKVEKAPEKTMTELVADSAVGIPETVFVDGKLDKNSITVVAKYDDNSEAAVHPDSIDLDTSVAKDNVEGKLVVGEFEYAFTINVIEKVIPVGLVADKLNRAFTGVEGTSYTSWSDKTSESGAVYAGQSAGGNDAIQLRTNNNNSGIITTTSGGTLKKVEVEWNENTVADRDLEIYGKNSAYESPENLYNSEKRGTLLATIHNGTTEVDIEDEFEYIGIKSKSSALYLNSITLYYQPAIPPVAVSSVSIEPKELEMYVGDDAQPLTATVLPEDATDREVAWSASPEGVVSVEEGVVTALKAGTATITASAGGVDSAEPCVVTVRQHVTGVTITPALNLVAGNKGNVVVTVAPEDAAVDTFTLVSDHPEIASVEQNGEVTAVAEGTAEITVTTTDGSFTAKCTVNVSALEISVTDVELVSDAETALKIGDAVDLEAHGYPLNATENTGVTWGFAPSSAEDVVSVTEAGHVVALKEGTATVRATSVAHNTLYKDVEITVSKVAVTSVTLNETELNLEVGGKSTLTAVVAPDNATFGTVTWESSDADVATVVDGIVTAKAIGTATITASADGESDKCEVTVTAAVPKSWQKLSEQPTAGSGYKLILDRENASTNGGLWYVKDQTEKEAQPSSSSAQDYRIATTQNIEEAADIEVIAATGGYNVKIGARYLFIGLNGTYKNVLLKNTIEEASILTYDTTYGFVTTIDNHVYGMGNNNTQNYTTLSSTNFDSYPNNYKACLYAYLPIPAPTGVTIDCEDEVNVGGTLDLAATVAPGGASQEVSWSIVSGGQYATLENGVLTGVADGEVTIKATAVGYQNVYAEKTISVSSTGPAVKYATKVTSTSEIVSGAKYYIGYENEGNSFVFSGVDGASDYESVAVTENGIEQKESLICVEITKIEGGYSLRVVGSDNNGMYMRGTSGKNELKFEETEQLNTISISDGLATIISNTSELVFNSASGQTRFRYYKPATVSGNPSVYLRPCIYMLAE